MINIQAMTNEDLTKRYKDYVSSYSSEFEPASYEVFVAMLYIVRDRFTTNNYDYHLSEAQRQKLVDAGYNDEQIDEIETRASGATIKILSTYN